MRGIAPWSGPALGGTVVTIAGSALGGASEAMRCRFGRRSESHPASAHGSDGVRCVSPSGLPTGWSTVELRSYGATLRSASQFYVHAQLLAKMMMNMQRVVAPSPPCSGCASSGACRSARCRPELDHVRVCMCACTCTCACMCMRSTCKCGYACAHTCIWTCTMYMHICMSMHTCHAHKCLLDALHRLTRRLLRQLSRLACTLKIAWPHSRELV